ncbi:uncharacterized protein LOC143059756 [Mytilus galloprovincialis]|uniref:uncharacterized protein LOC143059756 n=1 Tax=Mytilus galloprovincialis TaxID=29158 RepID=UPI003F7C4AC6
MRKSGIILLAILCFHVKGISPCNITISLLWTADKDTVTLVCKVNNLFWKVKFYSPSKQEVAHCLIPFPKSECYSLYGNYIKQERSTNTTVLKVKRRLDTASEVNGLWRCTHGTNRGGAVVNVSVQNNEGYGKSLAEDIFTDNCSEEFLAWTAMGSCICLPIYLFYKLLANLIPCWKNRKVKRRCCDFAKIVYTRRKFVHYAGWIAFIFPFIYGIFVTDCKKKIYFGILGCLMTVLYKLFLSFKKTGLKLKNCHQETFEKRIKTLSDDVAGNTEKMYLKEEDV